MVDTTSRAFKSGSNNPCYRNFAGSEAIVTGLWKRCGNHLTTSSRLCACGRPRNLAARRPVCIRCHRDARNQQAIATRIERSFRLARVAQRASRKVA